MISSEDRGSHEYSTASDVSGSVSPLYTVSVKDNGLMMSPMSVQRKTFFSRTFSTIGPGSIRGSIFTLCNAAIGAGVLSLPYVFALCGYVVGVFYIFLGAFASMWANRILAYYALKHGKKNYNDLISLAWGKFGANWLLYCIQIYVFGTLCSYQIILNSLFAYSLTQFGISEEQSRSKLYATYYAVPLAAFILFPLSCLEDMSKLKNVSILSLVAIIYITVMFVVEMPRFYNYYKDIAFAHPVYWDWNLFPGFAMICFSYAC